MHISIEEEDGKDDDDGDDDDDDFGTIILSVPLHGLLMINVLLLFLLFLLDLVNYLSSSLAMPILSELASSSTKNVPISHRLHREQRPTNGRDGETEFLDFEVRPAPATRRRYGVCT
jgi:hypothetical protein